MLADRPIPGRTGWTYGDSGNTHGQGIAYGWELVDENGDSFDPAKFLGGEATYEIPATTTEGDTVAGNRIKGAVLYTDDWGCPEVLAQTSEVVVGDETTNSDATGRPLILFNAGNNAGESAIGIPVESGQVLRYDRGSIDDSNGWDGTVHEYQWQSQTKPDTSDWEDIAGASGATYTIPSATDANDILRFRIKITYRDDDYAQTSMEEVVESMPTGYINIPPGGAPQIGVTNNLTMVGNDMSVAPAAEQEFIEILSDPNGAAAPFAYRWEKCAAGQDCGADGGGWTNLTNVEADPDTTDTAGQQFTGSSFTLLVTHAGYRFRYIVSYTDEDGSDEEAVSAVSEAVNASATGSVTIVFSSPRYPTETPYSRTPVVGEVLQADTKSIADLNGLGDFTYSWFREDKDGANRVPISGSTQPLYTLQDEDAGKKISLEVRFTDGEGNPEEPGASNPTDIVNDPVKGFQVNAGAPSGAPEYEVGGVFADRLQVSTASLRDLNENQLAIANRFDPITWAWARVNSDGVATTVSGQIAAVYTLTPEDAGLRIRATASYTDEDGFDETISATSDVVNARASGSPTISGPVSPEPGSVLTTEILSVVDNNGFDRSKAILTWIRVAADNIASDIAGAHGDTYTLAENDANSRIMVRVDFTDDDGFAESRFSALYPAGTVADGTFATVNGRPTGAPVLEGSAQVDMMVEVNTDGIDDANGLAGLEARGGYAYTWIRLNADRTGPVTLVGENSDSYTLVKDDEGKRIQVVVRFVDDKGYDNVIPSNPSAVVQRRENSAPQGLPVVSAVENCSSSTSAALKVGVAVKASTAGIMDDNQMTTARSSAAFSYQWVRLNADGSSPLSIGTDSDCYTLQKADEAKRLQVVVRYIDDDGYEETVRSLPTGSSVVRRDQVPATGMLAIVGTAQVDATLTADASSIVDPVNGLDAATMQYRWERLDSPNDPNPVTVGEGPSYTPVKADARSFLRLTVIFHDDDDHPEKLSVLFTGPDGVTPARVERRANAEATGAPVIRGAARVGETLEAFRGSIEDDNGVPNAGTFTWQWFRVDANGDREQITGATRDRYAVTPDDSEKRLMVRATFDDLDEYEESLDSSLTGLVTEIAAVRSSGLTHLLSGMGRTFSISLVDVVWERVGSLESWRSGPTASASIGGRVIDTGAFTEDDVGRAVEEVAGFLGLKAVSPELIDLEAGRGTTSGSGLDAYSAWAGLPTGRDLFGRSRISMLLGGGKRSDGGGLSMWAQGDMGAYERERADSEFSEANSEGTMLAGHLGFEYASSGGGLMGVALSHSLGEAEYAFADDRHSDATVDTAVTSAMPYLYFRSEGGAGVWASYGQGNGTLELADDVSDVETDIALQTTAAGFHGGALPYGDVALRLKADYFRTDVTADEVDDGSSLIGVDTFSSRARLVLEGTVQSFSDGGGRTTGKFELGARIDDGDVGEGIGAEAAAEVRFGSTNTGLELRGRGSVLFFHEQEGYREWGASLGLIYDPGRRGRGVSLTLEPAWNAPSTGVASAMWDTDSLPDYSGQTASSDDASFRARLGYGVGALHESGLVTLYSEVEDDDDRRLRLGSEFDGIGTGLGGLRLDLYGERRDSGDDPENAAMFKGTIGF